ncbi:uncharacterized protein LOC117501752 [Thalassophryne amazonica]|uniref:uncharacterized protein LOC117501752 n=1 Tax=Thalassophryne amazonica TaxID=390379 RepID=UPI00147091D6|nr:uncharacterized protein LOC117501752 [Thalassophryne amazonica]
METEAERRRREEYLEEVDKFRSNAIKIIEQMLDWANQPKGSRYLVDEILHSIFFLGRITIPQIPPDAIVTDKDVYELLVDKYPQPFKCYSSMVAQRSPFSCVLDMVVKLKEQQNEDAIKTTLKEFAGTLNPTYLVSTTICICQHRNTGKARQYGVSMSTSTRKQRQIVIGSSCCSTWEEYVASAVMTYYPGMQKNPRFDGTFKIPKYVRCEAFNIRKGDVIPPCQSCSNMFGLPISSDAKWPYGNCAEPESLSNLLKNDPEIKNAAAPTSPTYTPENREKAKVAVMNRVRADLKEEPIYFKWNGQFYEPQREW